MLPTRKRPFSSAASPVTARIVRTTRPASKAAAAGNLGGVRALMTSETRVRPYERQEDSSMCGAACLCMVYRSFDLAWTQRDIWRDLAPLGGFGGLRTHRLAADALQRGLSAM